MMILHGLSKVNWNQSQHETKTQIWPSKCQSKKARNKQFINGMGHNSTSLPFRKELRNRIWQQKMIKKQKNYHN